MLKFAVVGTNWISESFIEAAHASGQMKLSAVYSRSLEKAHSFGEKYGAQHSFASLDKMAESDVIEAVYIASPNSLHHPQTRLFLTQQKHVICEKPLASNERQAALSIACAERNGVVLFEAFKSAYLPNFEQIRHYLPKLGKIRKALFNYCQYSSRYQSYLDGKNTNTFSPEFSNGSIMDIGYYCVASAVALWGVPINLTASATLLKTGVDAHGSVILNYGDFDVVIVHSKVSDSLLASEIQGEEGTLTIEAISRCLKVTFTPRNGKAENISLPQVENSMLYEAQEFAKLVKANQVEHPGLANSLITAKLLTKIRQQIGVKFPADLE